MVINFLQKNKFFRNIIYRVGNKRAIDTVGKIKKFLNKNNSILDIGSGTCNVYEVLLKKGYNVVGLDVRHFSFVENIKPVLYDGDKIPFEDNTFDVALLLTVLHHLPYPEKIIKEAMRVSKKVIIIEDIYSNIFSQYLTYFFDCICNLEFIGHPHTNKDDKQWKDVFLQHGLNIMNIRYDNLFFIFKQATYYLMK